MARRSMRRLPTTERNEHVMETVPERTTRAYTTKVVAAAVVSAGLLLAGTWQDTGTARQTTQYGDEAVPADHQSGSAIRPHPRGLPRRNAHIRRRKDEQGTKGRP